MASPIGNCGVERVVIKRILLFFLIIFSLNFTLSAQILFYGIVPKEHVEKAGNEYNAIENGLLDGGYEIGLICFDVRDSNEYNIEIALYTARSLSARYVLLWTTPSSGMLSLKAYTDAGMLIAEKEGRPAEHLEKKQDRVKSINQAYFKFARDFAISLQGKL